MPSCLVAFSGPSNCSVSISRSANRIAKMDDDDIEKYIEHIIETKETSLNLSNRSLRAVPMSISLCPFLQNLYLNNNQLIIPPNEQLSPLINLETLSLEQNQLTILPNTLWKLISLVRLNLSHNPLGQIPLELGQLKNLHELWLTNLNLYDIPLNIFSHLNQLEKLSLKSNHLRRLPTDLGQLIELRWLSIEDNELNDLPDCLQDCLNLSYLNLNGNHFLHIPSVIGKISSLNIVCLQRNAIAEINDDTLLMFSNMTKVDLRENPLVEKPKHWKGLEFIKLGRCIDVTSFEEENDENNSESLDSSQDDHLE